MTVSVVIPCYRSKLTIRTVVDEIKETVKSREGWDYQIVLVNDCSPDETFSVIRELCEEDSRIIGVDMSRNFGQETAIVAGLGYATGDAIVVMDDDGVRDVAEEFSLQVLMTNIPLKTVDSGCPRRGLSSDGLLSLYIDQFTIEHDFKLMKSGSGVNRMFIHTPSRQDAVVFLSGLSTMVASVIDAVLEETAVDKHHDITTKHITDFMTNAIVKYYRDEHRMVFAGYEGVATEAMDILDRLELKPESLLGC